MSTPRRRSGKRPARQRGLRATAGGFSRQGKTVATPKGIFAKRGRDRKLRYYDARDGSILTRLQATLRGRALLGAKTRRRPGSEERALRKAAKRFGLGLRRWGSGFKATAPKRWTGERTADAFDAFGESRSLRGYGIAPVAKVEVEYPDSKVKPYDIDLTRKVPMRPAEEYGPGAGARMKKRWEKIDESVVDRGGVTELTRRGIVIYRGGAWEKAKVVRAVRIRRRKQREREIKAAARRKGKKK